MPLPWRGQGVVSATQPRSSRWRHIMPVHWRQLCTITCPYSVRANHPRFIQLLLLSVHALSRFWCCVCLTSLLKYLGIRLFIAINFIADSLFFFSFFCCHRWWIAVTAKYTLWDDWRTYALGTRTLHYYQLLLVLVFLIRTRKELQQRPWSVTAWHDAIWHDMT